MSRLIFRAHPDMVRAAWVRGRRLAGPESGSRTGGSPRTEWSANPRGGSSSHRLSGATALYVDRPTRGLGRFEPADWLRWHSTRRRQREPLVGREAGDMASLAAGRPLPEALAGRTGVRAAAARRPGRPARSIRRARRIRLARDANAVASARPIRAPVQRRAAATIDGDVVDRPSPKAEMVRDHAGLAAPTGRRRPVRGPDSASTGLPSGQPARGPRAVAGRRRLASRPHRPGRHRSRALPAQLALLGSERADDVMPGDPAWDIERRSAPRLGGRLRTTMAGGVPAALAHAGAAGRGRGARPRLETFVGGAGAAGVGGARGHRLWSGDDRACRRPAHHRRDDRRRHRRARAGRGRSRSSTAGSGSSRRTTRRRRTSAGRSTRPARSSRPGSSTSTATAA